MNDDVLAPEPVVSTDEKLRERAKRLLHPEEIAAILGQSFVLAGGAMRVDEPRDFDIFGVAFPIDLKEVRERCDRRPDTTVVCRTDNALTVLRHGQTIQFCRFHKPTPTALVWSFDFTHVQAGVVFDRCGEMRETAYSEHFNNVEQYSFPPEYNGSEYPLSSLSRLFRFQKRGDFAGENEDYFLGQVLKIMCDIVKRGFRDEADFQDQCSAISAALQNCDANALFSLLNKKGNKARAESREENPF